jgi:membrane-bound lytic murein transglycosylase MltF
MTAQHLIASTLLLVLVFAGCDAGKSGNVSETGERDASPLVEMQELASEPDADEPATADDALINPSTGRPLPMPFSAVWQPWLGDYEALVERRVIRVLVPYGGYQFYYDKGRPRGAIYELVQRFETYINEELGRRNIKVYVVVIPASRDELLPALLAGHADLVAADLTMTDERVAQVTFSRPLLNKVNEVVVTGPAAPELGSLDDLAGQEIVVRKSSSYYEHLQRLAVAMQRNGLKAPSLTAADEYLEAEDILEVLNAGMIGITVLDDYKAQFWSGVFPNIVVRDDLVINEGGSIAWAMRKESPELTKVINQFLRKFGKGTMIGNDTYNRYLDDASLVRCAHHSQTNVRIQEIAKIFRSYGEQYEFDWLMLAAQGYQESGLRQDRRSSAGAVGIMQIKPSTAADPNVGIDDVSTIDNNVHAGAKYMRFIADRYFSGDGITPVNQWLLSLAAYNAGPAKVARMRNEAGKSGYDRNIWFNNVEIVAAQRIGRETVTYVSNIFKYFVGYQMISERGDIRSERHGDTLTGCLSEESQ